MNTSTVLLHTALHARHAWLLHVQALRTCGARLAHSGTSATHQRTTQGSAAGTQKNVARQAYRQHTCD